MNLKPTLLKSIVSAISGVIPNYFLAHFIAQSLIVNCDPKPTELIGKFTGCPQPTWIQFAFNPKIILISIVVIALVYFIWSFIQKK